MGSNEIETCRVVPQFAEVTEPESKSRVVEKKDLASQLDLRAVSLSERILGYEPREVGSTPTLRAILIGE